MSTRGLVDGALEASVVGSFTRIGYDARRRLYRLDAARTAPPRRPTAIVTGATSGLGQETAGLLAALGAHVCVVGRDPPAPRARAVADRR